MSDSPHRSRKRIKSDKELTSFGATQQMYMIVGLKWFIALLFAGALLALFIAIGIRAFNNEQVMNEITSQVFDNLGSIVVAVAIFLGLKKFPGSSDNK